MRKRNVFSPLLLAKKVLEVTCQKMKGKGEQSF